ncbi:MAG: ABC transporter permease [Gammaproteobacteria bacterium]|nr:ABC transporter permease [Gammaproteobacteria bacterium]MCH2577102.1 ABC transporter permease subunit [Pseudomonadales bacterium]MEC7765872.1 ABC transporter permease subunit [Pseudomonadota bacterium]MBI91419.1 ABC transporter permease [Gammaproteobacteria bacterium]MED5529289.1 ABC transporter permease subunit [Pseudomonadota bacterium]|tara:strand:+ start:6399 stop:7133 length:735 start_codon:yes stop_codon:yes gene_type:complete
MGNLGIIFRRELLSYFATPLAYVFIVIFLITNGIFTFELGGFYVRGQADLLPFFSFHPWLYLFMVPAIAMTLWADERKTGSIELLLTLPIRLSEAVIGKFLAAWVLTGIALLLTFPIWLTVNYLGNPDNGVIVAAYMGSWFMAGGFLAIGSCLSACTKNPVIAFILTVAICFLFVIMGSPILLNAFPQWVPQVLVDAFSAMGFLTHFDSIARGVLDIRDFLFFTVFIAAWLLASAIVIEMKKAN